MYKITRLITISLIACIYSCGQKGPSVTDKEGTDTLHSFIPFDYKLNGHVTAMIQYEETLIFAERTTDNQGKRVTRVVSYDEKEFKLLGDAFDGKIMTFAVFRDTLYAAGSFNKAGKTKIRNIAKWDGENWIELDGGTKGYFITETTTSSSFNTPTIKSINGYVGLLSVLNDNLNVTGRFDTIGYIPAHNFARWDGKKWSALEDGTNDGITSLQLYKNELYAAGEFEKLNSDSKSNIARWNGQNWVPIGEGPNGSIYCLELYKDELYAAGSFTETGSIPTLGIARWNGKRWASVGKGMNVAEIGSVGFLSVYQNELYAGGLFDSVDNRYANGLAKWNGKQWNTLGNGLNNLIDSLPLFLSVDAMAVYKNNLIISGEFMDTISGNSANKIVRWTAAPKQK
ncbi:MAG: hypothetical protein IPN29_20425 [Saprospiraceae bacterium]|nr:hypothetical protein [Saprospiraceae bacterium]